MNRSIFLFAAMAAFLSPAIAQSPPAHAPASIKPLEKVVFATNWLAEGEHGGHYQAVVDGTYARYGLDVKIISPPHALLALGFITILGGALIMAVLRNGSQQMGWPTYFQEIIIGLVIIAAVFVDHLRQGRRA